MPSSTGSYTGPHTTAGKPSCDIPYTHLPPQPNLPTALSHTAQLHPHHHYTIMACPERPFCWKNLGRSKTAVTSSAPTVEAPSRTLSHSMAPLNPGAVRPAGNARQQSVLTTASSSIVGYQCPTSPLFPKAASRSSFFTTTTSASRNPTFQATGQHLASIRRQSCPPSLPPSVSTYPLLRETHR